MKYLANLITGCRIVGSLLLFFVAPFTLGFYILYVFCGLTDMIDGTVARKTNSVSSFGSRLDTFNDICFVGVCMIRIVPVVHMPRWLVIWIAIIAILKVATIVIGFIRERCFVAEHSIINKVTGGCLFIAPLTFPLISISYTGAGICLLATIAAIQENRTILKRERGERT